MKRRTRWILGTWLALALFVVATVQAVGNNGGWHWFVLLAVSYPASLYGAYRVGWMEP
jgi:hypothetical protein